MAITTYEQYQNLEISEKITLVQIDPAQRLVGWVLDSGAIYKRSNFDQAKILLVEDSGVGLTEVLTQAAVVAGTFYNDRINKDIYLETSDSADPNAKFIAITFRLYFANADVRAPNDVTDAASFEVEWLSLLAQTSDFGVALDNRNPNQIGVAVEGKGSIDFRNAPGPDDGGTAQDPLLVGFWDSRYDKLTWENKKVSVYSWNQALPITEAQIIFRGLIQSKSWTPLGVKFGVKDQIAELRGEMDLPLISALAGKYPTSLNDARQRRLYGNVFGHRPTNTDQLKNQDITGRQLAGTVSVTTATTAITGVGTSFLSDLTPGDGLTIPTADPLEDDTEAIIESIASDTSLTLSDTFDDPTVAGVTYSLTDPIHAKRFLNRGPWIIAHHRLRQPDTTVASATSSTRFTVVDASDLFSGDSITVGGESSIIDLVSGNFIKLSLALIAKPAVSASVVRNAIENVRINNSLMANTTDYTYSQATEPSTLTLTALAEFNIAPIQALSGTSVTVTTGLRSVTGSGTSFKSDLRAGIDWIRVRPNADFFEILSIESDTALTLRTNASYTENGLADFKAPQVFDTEKDLPDVLSLDCLGKTEDGLSSGTFLKTVPQIVENILVDAGLTDLISTQSFDDAADEAEQRVSFVIPTKFTDKRTGKFRDFINKLNVSIFGALIQDENYDLAYSVLSPKKPVSLLKLDESNTLSFSIKSLSDRIIKKAIVNYLFKEHDPQLGETGNLSSSKTSDIGSFLTKTKAEFVSDTALVDADDARHMVNRWAFLREISSNLINIKTKLQASKVSPTDAVQFTHKRSFERFGSSDKVRIGGVQSAKKSGSDSNITLEDLNGAFVRVANITPASANDFTDASIDEKAVNGYITDANGMQGNDPDTHGINLIW